MKFRQRIKYMIDQFLSIGTFAIVMMLFLITFISVLIIGYLSIRYLEMALTSLKHGG